MKEMFYCDVCRCKYPQEQMVLVGDDVLCEHCADTDTIICDECGRQFYTVDARGNDEIILCPNCYEYEYTHCCSCDTLLRNDDIYYSQHGDIAMCQSCYEKECEAIHEYSYAPNLVFHGEGVRHLGVELEIDSGGQDSYNAQCILDIANKTDENLYIKSDGSLDDGFEMVTHPMTIDYHMNEMPWEQILEAARCMDYLSHKAFTCGLHVHISRLAFGDTYEQQELSIARLVYFVERFWAEMLRFSRRTQAQLDRWAARYGMKLSPQDQMEHAKNKHYGRYMAVNLTNTNTVEIRIFRGTLKLNTLLDTLQFVNHLCEVAIFMSDDEIQNMSWYDFIERVNEPELITYLKERQLYVNTPVDTEEDD